MKTEWDFTLFYSSPKDKRIESDMQEFEASALSFSKKWRGKDFSQPSVLRQALVAYEPLQNMPKPLMYFYLLTDKNSKDQEAQAKLTLLSERVSKAGNDLVFFELALGALPQKVQKELLKSSVLSEYRYFLKVIFDRSKHNLSEDEEKIMNRMSLPSHSLWVQGTEKMLGEIEIPWKKRNLPLPEAVNMIAQLNTSDRRKLHKLVMQALKEKGLAAENEMNAICIRKKIIDDLRKYEKPYSGTVLGYENDPATVETLLATVAKSNKLAHRFYKAKAKMLGMEKLTYADRGVRVRTGKKQIPFEKGHALVLEAFKEAGEKYPAMLSAFLKSGQIDVYPGQGKTGGAYCFGSTDLPTCVLLNYTESFEDLLTLAHEMGHAFHTELSKTQRPLYQGYTTSVAEVASTFFETLAFEALTKDLPEKERMTVLHNRLSDDINTIFRQVACFNFELEMHTMIREKGSVSHIELAKTMNKHMKAYLGPAFELTPDDGYFFVYWSHIRRFFYVYTYAYGQLVSRALYERYREDPAYIEKVEEFLSAGGSKSPEQIFKDIGVDTAKPAFWQDGLESIERDIAEFEKLVKHSTK